MAKFSALLVLAILALAAGSGLAKTSAMPGPDPASSSAAPSSSSAASSSAAPSSSSAAPSSSSAASSSAAPSSSSAAPSSSSVAPSSSSAASSSVAPSSSSVTPSSSSAAPSSSPAASNSSSVTPSSSSAAPSSSPAASNSSSATPASSTPAPTTTIPGPSSTTPGPSPTTSGPTPTTKTPGPSPSTPMPSPSSSTPSPSSSGAPPKPTPSSSYAVGLYSDTDCELDDHDEIVTINVLNATDKCVPMGDEYPGFYYVLPADGTKLKSKAQFICDTADCKNCQYEVSALNKCSKSALVSTVDKPCVGASEIDDDDSTIWVEEFDTPEGAATTCSVASALQIVISNVAPADGKCVKYGDTAEEGHFAMFKANDDKKTYTVRYDCSTDECKECTVSNDKYTMGSCTDDVFVFKAGKNLDECGGSPSTGKSKKNGGVVAGAAIGAILVVACLGFIYFKFIRRRTSEYSPIS